MSRPSPFESTGERLAGILEIAGEQRELLARGDLGAVQNLQARRQQLMEGIQSPDKRDKAAQHTLEKILDLDRRMNCLLSSEAHDIKETNEDHHFPEKTAPKPLAGRKSPASSSLATRLILVRELLIP